jgi:quercetin dioxygenase-like cupin family protein
MDLINGFAVGLWPETTLDSFGSGRNCQGAHGDVPLRFVSHGVSRDAVSDKDLLSWHPSTIRWQQLNPDRSKYALLQGSREAAGKQFTYALLFPPGFVGRAHRHSGDLRVAVVRGELLFGMGSKVSRRKMKRFPEGSYLLIPAGAPHYEATKKTTVVISTAIGPWVTTQEPA